MSERVLGIADPLGASWVPAALLLGLVAGSFANVLIHRLPRGESVVLPASRCPRCLALIRPLDNVPVLSYLVLGGRCRGCREPISPRYPLVELANGTLWLLVALSHGATPRALVLMPLTTALLVLTLVDMEHQLLPNAITLPGIAAGLAASFLPGSPVSPRQALLAAVSGYLGFFLVAYAWKRLRGVEALGQGDWKMAGMLGAFLGPQPLLLTVFLATLLGSLVGGALMLRGRGDLQSRLPLGSFLGLSALFVVFAGDAVLAWYRALLEA